MGVPPECDYKLDVNGTEQHYWTGKQFFIYSTKKSESRDTKYEL